MPFPINLRGKARRTNTDPDAAAWATAVTANSGTYSAATLSKLSTLIAGMKAAGLWTKMALFNPMCGDQLAACLIQYKGGSWGPATNNNFVAGDFTEATGLTGNGSTKSLSTGLVANTLTANDTHMAVYNRSSTAAAGGVSIGAESGTDTFRMLAPFTDGTFYSDQYNATGGAGRVSAAATTPYGFLVGSRTAAAAHAIYRNGSSIASNATSGGSLPAFPISVFATNAAGTPAGFISQPLAIYSAGSGLSAGDVTNYNTLVQTFQTSLSRNV